MEIIRVEVIEPKGRKRKFKPLWLAWLGKTMPPVEQLWLKYLRRFAIEHWYRFAKQRLHWTLPQLGTTQAGERWRDLMPLLTWQLWLARQACIDCPLPWQSPSDRGERLNYTQFLEGTGRFCLSVCNRPCHPISPKFSIKLDLHKILHLDRLTVVFLGWFGTHGYYGTEYFQAVWFI